MFGADIEVAPVDDLSGLAGGDDVWAEVADPDVIVDDDFDADTIGGEEVADLKFGAAVVNGGGGGFIGSEEEDGREGSGSANNIHLDREELLFAVKGSGRIGEKIFAEMLWEFGVRSEGLKGED